MKKILFTFFVLSMLCLAVPAGAWHFESDYYDFNFSVDPDSISLFMGYGNYGDDRADAWFSVAGYEEDENGRVHVYYDMEEEAESFDGNRSDMTFRIVSDYDNDQIIPVNVSMFGEAVARTSGMLSHQGQFFEIMADSFAAMVIYGQNGFTAELWAESFLSPYGEDDENWDYMDQVPFQLMTNTTYEISSEFWYYYSACLMDHPQDVFESMDEFNQYMEMLGEGPGAWASAGARVDFEMYIDGAEDPAPVPVPSAALLLASGIFGVIGFRRNKTTTVS